MSIQKWSEEITVAELADDPMLSEELAALINDVGEPACHVVLNMAAVSFLNSSNIAKLLRLRKQVLNSGRRLILCGVNTQVWGILLVTGLDKILEFTNDISTALTTLQMGAS